MRRIGSAVTFVFAVLAGGTTALAQAVEPGTRVRLTLTSGGSAMSGTLVEVRGDTLVLDRDAGEFGSRSWAVASEIKTLQRSVGRKSQVGTGALGGAVGGAAVGAILGFLAADDAKLDCHPNDPGCVFVAALVDPATTKAAMAQQGAMAGGLVGLVIGSVIGLATSTDRWQAVEAADHPVRIGLRPAGASGARAGFAFAFGSAPRR